MTQNSMQDQIAVVVGGSGAIGSAICRHFAQAGATCVVTYNSGAQAAKDLVASLSGKGHWVAHVPVDESAVLGALAAQVQSKHGRLEVLVNCAGVTAMGSNVAYRASKAALDSMTKLLARALAPEIRVLSVSPGLVDTDFVKNLDQKWCDEQAARTPLKRLATADEIEAAALAVAVHLNYSTGCIIAIDGGRPFA